MRVGNHAISKATLQHWARVIEHGGSFSGFRGKPRGTATQRAVALLVSAYWLTGEAERQGVPVRDETVDQMIEERQGEGPEFERHLRMTGQTLAGLKLELRAELAGEEVRQKLAEQADAVAERESYSYYRKHRRLFSTPELRVTDLLEGQPSPSAAAKLVGRIGTGARFAKLAYHEQVTHTPGVMRTAEKARLVDAIFAAPVGRVSTPMPLNGNWAVFVVRKVVPPEPQPFAKVQMEVAAHLRALRQKELKKKFDREYVERWRAVTSCRAPYLGPGCPGFPAPLGAYEDPFSDAAHPMFEESVTG